MTITLTELKNHFKNVSILDIYKVIIKDFFIIKQDVTKIRDDVAEIRNDVAEIRDLEYKTIGTDRIITIIEVINSKNNKHKDDIFKNIKKYVEKLLIFTIRSHEKTYNLILTSNSSFC
ncbi:hypothetical protein OLW00_04935 [Campylobacter jejuni]|nr:hypothetical protein [Campylobacter jejuni]